MIVIYTTPRIGHYLVTILNIHSANNLHLIKLTTGFVVCRGNAWPNYAFRRYNIINKRSNDFPLFPGYNQILSCKLTLPILQFRAH